MARSKKYARWKKPDKKRMCHMAQLLQSFRRCKLVTETSMGHLAGNTATEG